MWQIPSLKSISFLKCAFLTPDIIKMEAAGISPAIIASPETISHFGKASLSMQTASASMAAKTQLEFETADSIPASEPLAFIAEAYSGERFLIGAFEPPFPKIDIRHDSGDSPKAQNKITVSVSWPFKASQAVVWLPSDAQLPVS